MKLDYTESPFEFKKRLEQAERPTLKLSRQAPQDATVIDGTWSLVVEGEGAAITFAADELRRYFHDAGISLKEGREKPRIRLRATEADGGEEYTLQVDEREVLIESTGERGVIRGVYTLEEQLVENGGPWLRRERVTRSPWLETRILRSFWSPHYVDELTVDEVSYPDGYLETLSRNGYNGIWTRGYLRDIVPSSVFGEFGQDSAQRIERLQRLIERADRYGIDVYLYFCEPRALATDDPFWERYPHLRGHSDIGRGQDVAPQVTSMCTSRPETLAYIEESFQRLLATAPRLGGVILINASENQSHCYSRGGKTECPICQKRKPVDVAAEVITSIRNGVRRGSERAKVIAWTWSWKMLDPDPQTTLISKLPEDVIVMSDFERGDEIIRRGRTFPLDEYAMSIVGPSKRFHAQMQAAQNQGRKTYGKMQVSNTHELATVPYFPIPWRMAAKWEGLRSEGVCGVMGCWIFGNYPSFSMEVTRELTWEPHPPLAELVSRVARRIFGRDGASAAMEAWRHFGEAFESYPFATVLLYYGPVNRAPAIPWTFPGKGLPMTPSWRPGPPGDSIERYINISGTEVGRSWLGPFEPDFAQACFQDVSDRWEQGISLLSDALEKSHADEGAGYADEPTPAQREWIVAKAFAIHMKSTVHLLRFAQARDALEERGLSGKERARLLSECRSAVADEIVNRAEYPPLLRADSRLGFHSEVEDYFFTVHDVEASLEQLRALQRTLDEQARVGA